MNQYIYQSVEKLIKRFHTRDPFELLEALNVVVSETDSFKHLKGYCFTSCQTIYVGISSFLSDEEKRIVAAHELGHVVLHKKLLQLAPMKDSVLYGMTCNTEYEANLFAADLLISDEGVATMSQNEDLSYFGLCSNLDTTPELMSFKLYSLMKRGNSQYNLVIDLDDQFLRKSTYSHSPIRTFNL